MNKSVKKYLAEIGSRGGRSSRRELPPETARKMVKIREARRAYKKYYAQCFWSSPRDYLVSENDIPWVADRLMTYGGREGWTAGAKLCR